MVAEVSGASAANQTVQTRATEEAQTQTTRRTSNNQPQEGVEVRISQRQAENAPVPEDLTYENIRPRNGSAPQAERAADPRAEEEVQEAVLAEEPLGDGEDPLVEYLALNDKREGGQIKEGVGHRRVSEKK